MKNLNLFTWLLECSGNAAKIGLIPCQLRQQDGKNTAKTRQKDGKSSIYRRIITLLTLLLTLGVGQMWGDNAGLYQGDLTYSYNGTTYTVNTGTTSTDLSTPLNATLKVTKVKFYFWYMSGDYSRWGNVCGGLLGYNLTGGDCSSEYTMGSEASWNDDGWVSDSRHKQITITRDLTIASPTSASGNYTFNYYFKGWGDNDEGEHCGDNWYLSNNSSNYALNYTVSPPAISSFSVSRSGYISGAGTNVNPYIVEYNSGTLTLTVNGSKEHTDANSTLKYWLNSGSKQTESTITISNVTATTNQTAVVHAQCINNSDENLVGTESNATIYYKAGYAITPVAKYTTDGSTYTTGTTGGTVTINGSSSAIGVVKDATYSIVATPASGYCVEEIKVGDVVAWSQPNDDSRQTAAKTISTYTATAATNVTVKFAKLQDITLYIHEGGVGGLVLQNYQAKVGEHNVLSSNTTLTAASNGWYYHTFANVTKVSLLNVACANVAPASTVNGGQPIGNYTLSQTEYFSAIHSQNVGSSSICDLLGVSYTNQSYSIGSPAITLNPTYTLAPSGSPTYSWSVTTQPVGGAYSLSATNVASPTFSSTVEGTYTLQVQVTTGGCTKSTSFDVVVANGVPDPEISGATFVTNPILSNAHLQISVTYANIPAEGCYIRLKHDGYWNDENNSAWTALSSGSGSMTFTTNNTNVPTGTWTIELYNNAKSLLSSTNVTGSLSVLTAQTITISAGANGSVSPTTVYAGSGYRSESFTATPNDHYHFVNWSNNNSSNVTVNNVNSATTYVSTAAAAATITANFAGDQYTISYYDQGGGTFTGTQTSEPTTHTYGTATTLKIPTKTGYTFGGWYTASNCSTGAVGNTTSASLGATAYTANIILYAKWTEKMTTVTVNVNPAGAGTLTVDAAAFTAGSTTTAGVTTSHTVVAAANSGKAFQNWTVTGNATGSASTNTYTLNGNGSAGEGTLTANFGIASGWYIYGDSWETWTAADATEQLTYQYRDISGVYYIPTTIAANKYFRLTDKSNELNFSSNTSDDLALTKGTVYTLANNSTKATYSTTNLGDVWVVMNTNDTKKAWVQDPATYYTITLANGSSGNTNNGAAGTEGTVTLKTNDLGNLQTKQYASGERVNIAIDTIAGYRISSVTLGATAVTMTHSSGTKYTGYTTMPASNATLTVTYRQVCKVTYNANNPTTGTAPANQTDITVGTNVTLRTNTGNLEKTDYIFLGWNTQADGLGTHYDAGATVNDISGDLSLFAEWKHIPTLSAVTASPTGTQNYAGSPIDFALSVTSTYMAHPVVVFLVNDGTTTYEVVGAPYGAGGNDAAGTIGSDAANTTVHKATFTASAAKSYTVSAKLYEGELIDNFEGENTRGWAGDNLGSGSMTFANNPVKMTVNGSNKVMQVTRTSGKEWGGAIMLFVDNTVEAKTTCDAAGSNDYAYIHARMKDATDATHLKNNDAAGHTGDINPTFVGATSSDWRHVTYHNTHCSNNFLFFMIQRENTDDKTVYIDDIILSNEETMTEKASEAATASFTINWNYTVTLNNNGATSAGTTSVDVTYGSALSNITVPTKTGYTFYGYYTEDDGAGTLQINASGVWQNAAYVSAGAWNSGSNQTLYAKWTGNEHTVSFNYGTGSGATASKDVTFGSAYGELPDVTAPSGCVFSGWFTAPTGGTLVEADTLVTTDNDHTLYARITQRDRVYFYNNLGWSDVYVTYDASYWDDNNGTGNYGKIYHHMTQIAGTDIWYDDIPVAVLSSWKYFIAFNSQQLGTIGESSDYGNFDKGDVVFRHDFDSYATMFVPERDKTDTWKKNNNNCTYYSSSWTKDDAEGIHGENYRQNVGYWMRYNDIRSGYTITGSWDSWANSTALMAATPGETTFTMTKTLAANTTYEFLLYKEYTTNTFNHVFTDGTPGTMRSSSCTDWAFWSTHTKYSELESNHTKIATTVAGEYTFQLKTGTDGRLLVSVIYPLAVNDYRVTYSWTESATGKSHSSEIIKGEDEFEKKISVFVHSSSATGISGRTLQIEKCTAISGSGVPTWTSGNTIDISSVDESGVYNFVISKTSGNEPTGAFSEKYEGNYYIRTESSEGGWNYYKEHSDNIMTYSDYSMTQTLSDPYSHYYCRYIENTGMDITYQIATDYSPCVSDILVGDLTIGGVENKTLPSGHPANIRFTWNEKTNALRRAYLKSAQGGGNTRFLVLHGDAKIFDASTGEAIMPVAGQSLDANELLFSDLGNWIYQVELQAYPSATVKLIAQYNGSDRYLVGDADHSMTIMGGTAASTKYAITAVYDFKTNRLMTVWTPSGAIGDDLKDVDMLLIRHAQENATSVTFSGSGKLTTKKVYGAIELRRDELVGHVASWTSSSRPLLKYMISFPFDVNISDVFGLNTRYGDAYVIQKYDGADRAARGFFRGDGTTTFWKDMEQNEVMRANVGYCVIFDNDYLNDHASSIWENKGAGSKVYLYFPSAGNVGAISNSTKDIEVTALPCNIDREFTVATRTLNHKYTDSNWNLIGVPIFQNSDGVTSSATITTSEDTGNQGESYGTFYYFYNYDVANNRYSIASAAGYNFKTMYSYMLQYAGTVTFTGSTPSSVAARRIADTKKYEIELQVLRNDEEVINRTFVNLKENACDTFALNEDVYMSPNSAAVNIYTLAGNYDVAANVLSIDNHIVPVGVEVTKAGTYTFSMPSDFDGTVVLVDNFDGSRTDLSLGDYSVALPKGTIEDRFTLEINIERSSATDIEGIEGGTIKDGKAHKFVRDGIMYILRDGVIYDAMGKRVK